MDDSNYLLITIVLLMLSEPVGVYFVENSQYLFATLALIIPFIPILILYLKDKLKK